MKYLLLIITLLLSSPSWSESVSSDDIVINPTDGLVYKKFTTEPFTGSVTPTSDNPLKGSFKKGKKHGLWLTFYENRLVNKKVTFKDGKLDGLWEMYSWSTGELEFIQTYKGGKNGLFQIFDQDGTIRTQIYKDGEIVND